MSSLSAGATPLIISSKDIGLLKQLVALVSLTQFWMYHHLLIQKNRYLMAYLHHRHHLS